jgi:hypothetical protein
MVETTIECLERKADMRVFVVKPFARFQRREGITDAMLCAAFDNARKGLIDAELGGEVVKQRVPRRGQGKSGGYRVLIAFRRGERAVFLYGFGKNERPNIRSDQLAELKLYAQRWLGFDDKRIGQAIAEGDLSEVHCEKSAEGA